jgi:hypothetical protein
VPVMMTVEVPRGTTDLYDGINERMGIGPERMPEGLIAHQAGATDGGLLIVDVWESQEAFDRFFREQAGPVLQEMGVPQMQPRFFRVHNLVERGRGERAGVIMIAEVDGLGPDDYDAMISKMDAHADGGAAHPAVMHVAGVGEGGMTFVDVWDSPESFGRFAESEIGPAAGDALAGLQPRFVPIHNRLARG